MPSLILIVEDEPAQAEVLSYNLKTEGYRVNLAGDGEEALLMIEEEKPDLVVLDWMLPHVSGIEVCRRLQNNPTTKALPVIMLTARGEEADKVRGLETGADDFMSKPYSPKEMIARVRAVLRRASGGTDEDRLESGSIVMDLAQHKVTRNDVPVHLGPTEFRLLKALMEKPGRVFSREQLLDRAWGRNIYVELRTVDVHIRRLRHALGSDESGDVIRTVRGSGYAFEESLER